MSRSSRISRIETRRLITSSRFWVVMVLTAVYLEAVYRPIRAYIVASGARVGLLGMLVYIMNDAPAGAFLTCGCLGLLFDVPCVDDMQRAILLRSGRRAWAKGILRYIARVCLIYLLSVMAILFLLSLPHMEFTLGWSETISAFVQEFLYETYDSMLNYDTWIMNYYTAWAAFAIEFVLRFGVMYLLAVVMANINLMTDSRIGFTAAVIPMGVDLLLEQYFPNIIRYFSPFTLCRLSGLDYGDGMLRPPVQYAFAVLLFAGVAASRLLLCYVRRREIHI